MFDDIPQRWVEPTPDQYNAYFYDIDGAHFDLSIIPDFLREYIEYPEYGSGTNKFLYLFYQLASRANIMVEVGTFTGVSTVAFAKGIENNGGSMLCLDTDLSRPLLHYRLQKHNINNVTLVQGNDLEFDVPQLFDMIYIDTTHLYEQTVKELFLFDKNLRPGGIFVLHDIVVPKGINLINSKEDYGYINGDEFISAFSDNRDGQRNRHISQWPVAKPTQRCLLSPVFLAIQTFLSYRSRYNLLKIMDFGGVAIIFKPH